MKNRRTIIVAFLLVAVMIIGVGFANLIDTLVASGSAKISKDGAQAAFDEDVYFSSASTQDASKASATVDPTDNDTATITVLDGVLNTKGDNAVVYLEIKNNSDLTVYITTEVTGLNDTYFGVELQYAGITTGYATLAPGQTLDVGVTVSCAATPTSDVSTTFDIEFKASTTAPGTP